MITVATESEMLAEQQAREDYIKSNAKPQVYESQIDDRDWNTVKHPNCFDFDRFSKVMRNV